MRSPTNPFLFLLQVFALPSSYNDHGHSKAEECQLFSVPTSVYPFNVESGTVFDERVFAFVPSVKSCCSVASSSTSTTLSTYAPNGISFSGQGGTTTMRSPTNPFLFLLQVFVLIALPSSYNHHGQSKAEECQLFSVPTSVYPFNVESGTVFDERVFAFVPSVKSCCSVASSSTSTTLSTYAPNGISFSGQGGTTTMRSPTNPFLFLLQVFVLIALPSSYNHHGQSKAEECQLFSVPTSVYPFNVESGTVFDERVFAFVPSVKSCCSVASSSTSTTLSTYAPNGISFSGQGGTTTMRSPTNPFLFLLQVFVLIALPSSYNHHGQSKAEECQLFSVPTSVYPFNVESGTVFDERVFAFVPSVKSCCSVASSSTSTTLSTYAPNGISFSGQGGTTTMRSPTNPFLFLLQVFVLIALPSSYNHHGQSKAEECQLFSVPTSVYPFNVESGTVFDERVFAFVPSVKSCCSVASSSTSTTLSTYAPNGISFSGQGGTTTMRSPTNPFLFLLQVFVLIALPSSYNHHGQSKAEECQLFSVPTSVYPFNVESGTVFDERVFAFVPSVKSCCSVASSSTSTTLSTYAPNGISFSGQGGTTTMRSPTNPFLFLLQVFVLIALPSSYNHHGQSKAEECQLFSVPTSVYPFNVESGTVFDERVFAFVPSVKSCCSVASSSTSTTLSTYAPNGISFSGQGGTTTMRSPTNPFLFLLQVFVLIALPSSYNHHGQSKAEECQLFSVPTSVYPFNVESGTVFDERVFAFVPSVKSCCSVASSSTSTTLSTYAPNGISFSGQGGTTTMRSPTNPFLFLLQVFVLIALPSSYNHHGQSKAEECQLFSVPTSVYPFNVESGTVFDERVFAFVPSVKSCCSVASSSTSTTLSTYAPNGISFSGQGGTTTMRSPTNPFLFLLQVFVLIALPSSYNHHGQSKAEECQLFSVPTSVYPFNVESGTVFDERVFAFVPSVKSCCSVASSSTSTTLSTYAPNGISFSGQGGTTTMRSPTNPFLFLLQVFVLIALPSSYNHHGQSKAEECQLFSVPTSVYPFNVESGTVFDERVFAFVPSVKSCCSVASSSTSTTLSTYAPNGISFSGQGGTTTMRSPTNPFLFLLQVFVLIALPSSYNHHGQSKAEECQLFSVPTSVYPFNVESGTVFDERVFAFVPSVKSCCSVASSSTSTTLSTYAPNGISFSGQGGTTTMRSPTNPFLFLLQVFVLIALPSSYNHHGQSKAEECQLFSVPTSVYPFNVESGTVFDERVFAFVPSVKSCCSVASSSTSTTLSTYAPNGISFSGQGGTTTMRSPTNPFLFLLQVFVLIALPSSYNHHGQSKAEECQLFSVPTSVYPFNVESGTVFDERVFAFVPSVKSCCSVASSSTSTTLSTYAPNGISFSGQGGTTTMRSPTNPFLFLLQVFVLIALPSSYNHHGQSKAEECQLFSVPTSVYPFNVESGTVFDERVFAFVPSMKSCCSVASSSTSTTLSTYAPNGISFSGQGGTTTMRSPTNPFLFLLQVFVLIALPSSYNDHGQSKAEECQLFSVPTSVYPFNVESGTVFDERVFAFVPSVKSCCSVASSSTSTTLSTYAPSGISFSGQGGTTTMRSPTNPFLFLLQILARQICDRALNGSVIELPGFVSIEQATAQDAEALSKRQQQQCSEKRRQADPAHAQRGPGRREGDDGRRELTEQAAGMPPKYDRRAQTQRTESRESRPSYSTPRRSLSPTRAYRRQQQQCSEKRRQADPAHAQRGPGRREGDDGRRELTEQAAGMPPKYDRRAQTQRTESRGEGRRMNRNKTPAAENTEFRRRSAPNYVYGVLF
ncbi:hypothetical protein ISCGN_014353 [Ixodes scapularis]